MSNRKGLGALPGKVDLRDYKLKHKKYLNFRYPEKYVCPFSMKIKDQGMVGSCVAHATSSILSSHFGVDLSTDFIYGIRYKLFGPKSGGVGMYLRDACKIVTKYGDPELYYCPTNTEVSEVYEIANKVFDSVDAMENAEKHKIGSYVKVDGLTEFKYSLLSYGPILSAVIWYDDNEVDEKGILHKGTIPVGGHAIVMKGWTPDGWVCQNSWGKEWGKDGDFILPWDYPVEEAYVFLPQGVDDDDINKKSCFFIRIFEKIRQKIRG